MLDNKGFDLWSKEYDKSVEMSSKEYPFDGYYDVLTFIYNSIEDKENKNILDIGFGTGLLTNKLYESGANISGIDFSQGMIDIAKEKMPNGLFIQRDFNLGIPSELKDKKFDYIISSYAIHHLDNLGKVKLINQLKNILSENGKIIIADVGFKTNKDLLACKEQYSHKWDESEIYIVEEDIVKQLQDNGLDVNYTQMSSCAGVLGIN